MIKSILFEALKFFMPSELMRSTIIHPLPFNEIVQPLVGQDANCPGTSQAVAYSYTIDGISVTNATFMIWFLDYLHHLSIS